MATPTSSSEDDKSKYYKLIDVLRNNQSGGIPLAKIGGYWLPVMFPSFWHRIHDMTVRPDDVFICTFPKCGTHWVHHLCYMIQTGNIQETTADGAVSILEIPIPPGINTSGQHFDGYDAKPSPRRICTHLAAKFLPENVNQAKLIYVYRDVKDVAVSFYNHYAAICSDPLIEYHGTFDNFARLFMSGEVAFGPYEEHMASYLTLKHPNMLILRYEDLHSNLEGAIQKIAKFLLGHEIASDKVEKIKCEASVESMRNNNVLNWSTARKRGVWKQDREFIRKGIVGDWRNFFTNENLLIEFDDYVKTKYPSELFE